jgi:Fe2+ transport system protein B
MLLGASALVMGAAGVALLFAPAEVLSALGAPHEGALPVLVQLLAALYFAWAMSNWAAKGSLIGGIYNRPMALGNLTHFAIGAISLAKAAAATHNALVLAATAIYALFAIGFAMLFFRSPVPPQ